MRPMVSLVAAFGLVTSAALIRDHVQAQTVAPTGAAVDVTKLGPQVGDKVPDFTLSDQRGQPRSLASLVGPNGLVLAFNGPGIEYVTVDSLAKTPGFQMIARLQDGAVFAPAPAGATPIRPPTVAPPSPRR